jgi:MFS transporter, SHS family, lactate transporter
MTNTTAATIANPARWWKEPTRDQWYVYIAAWLGWTLDAFDFTVFLLIMYPIAEAFRVSMLVGTIVAALSFIAAIALGPETKGKVLVPDVVLA